MSARTHIHETQRGATRGILAALVVALGLGGLALWRIDGSTSLSHAPIGDGEVQAFDVVRDDAAGRASASTHQSTIVEAPTSSAAARNEESIVTPTSERWSGGRITGHVLGGPGASEPVVGREVRAHAPRSSFPVKAQRTRTDRDGQFEFVDLVAARWEIDARATALEFGGTAFVVLDEIELPRAEVEIHFPYERHVEVRLVDKRGDPITSESLGLDRAFLPVVAVGVGNVCVEPGHALSPKDTPLSRVADKSPKGERHTFDVVIQSAGAECLHALFGDRVLASRPLLREEQSVELFVDPAEVARLLGPCSVHVVDKSDGSPIPAGIVRFQGPSGSLERELDRYGLASLFGVPFGTVRIRVEARGFISRAIDVEVPTKTALRVELAPARRLGGRIVFAGSGDASRFKPAVWRVSDPAKRLGDPTAHANRPTAEDFGFDPLEAGIYVVAAVPGSVGLLTADDIREGRGSGAAWVDLRRVDVHSIVLDVPAWLDEP